MLYEDGDSEDIKEDDLKELLTDDVKRCEEVRVKTKLNKQHWKNK